MFSGTYGNTVYIHMSIYMLLKLMFYSKASDSLSNLIIKCKPPNFETKKIKRVGVYNKEKKNA